MPTLSEALHEAYELTALVRQGLIDKAQANKQFSKRHGIPLFPVKPKRRKSHGKRAS